MNQANQQARIAGALMVLGMIAGLMSVSPSVDGVGYLTQAAALGTHVIMAAAYQFILALIYLAVALLLYGILARIGKGVAIGFLSFRIVAATLMIVGTVLLLSLLVLSQEHVKASTHDAQTLEIIGNMLKYTRDYFNHVFMVMILGVSNLFLYYLFFRLGLVPRWMSVWGLIGTGLSMAASVSLLFQQVEVISAEYLWLNGPTALFELVLGLWLLIKGLRPDA